MCIVIMAVTIQKKATYRDISEELRARIALLEEVMANEQAKFTAEQEKAAAAHKQSMDAIKGALANYRSLLELEQGFAKSMLASADEIGPKQEGQATSVNITLPAAKPPLADFFVKTLAETGPMSKDELRQVAVDAGYEIDGRHVHATLVNIQRNGRILPTLDGKYAAKKLEKALL